MSFSARIGYARVSSVDQPLDRQLAQFKEQGIEKPLQTKFLARRRIVQGFSK